MVGIAHPTVKEFPKLPLAFSQKYLLKSAIVDLL
jgi:hypothetical protein